jgi:glycosyltransferase involved in cell wall biosynthesis
LLYGACDLGLLPLSDNDFNRSRLPLKLLDMIGAGCPVLASGVGDVVELGRQLPGIVLTGSDEASFVAGAAAAVMDDPQRVSDDLRTRAGELEAWTWAHRARELEQLYRRLCGAVSG